MPFLRFHPQNGTFLELSPSDFQTAIQEPKRRPTASPGKGVTFRDSLARSILPPASSPPFLQGVRLHASGSRTPRPGILWHPLACAGGMVCAKVRRPPRWPCSCACGPMTLPNRNQSATTKSRVFQTFRRAGLCIRVATCRQDPDDGGRLHSHFGNTLPPSQNLDVLTNGNLKNCHRHAWTRL